MRNERSVPSFDPTRPRELVRYLEDLEDHFTRCAIADLDDRKKWTLKYVPMRVADLWESLPEWTAAKDWATLKTAVQKRYPASTDTQRFTYQELLRLVRERSRKEITSITEWSEYLNEYLEVSLYLVKQSRLSELEQRRYLLESLSTNLHREVSAHMRNVNPTRDPEEVEEVSKIDEAVSYCLRSPQRVKFEESPTAIPSNSSAPVKQESTEVALAGLVAQLVQKELVQRARSWGPPPNRSNDGRVAISSGTQYSEACHYCGHQGHIMRQCAVVDEDVNFNRCARNPEGRIVLPNGQFLPRTIPGATMRDRIEEWHKRNGSPPRGDSTATTSMMLSVDQQSNQAAPAVATLSNQRVLASYDVNPPQILKKSTTASHSSAPSPTPAYPLSKTD